MTRTMRPFDLNGLRTYDLASRPSKVGVSDLGRPVAPTTAIGDWLDSLPKQLAANELRKLRDHFVRAHTMAVPLRPRSAGTSSRPAALRI